MWLLKTLRGSGMARASDDFGDTPRADRSFSLPHDRQVELEERIHKLETALAEKPAAAMSEDAVAERVIAKLATVSSAPQAGSDRVLVLASTSDELPPPPKGAVIHPPAPADPTRRMWFLTQLLLEFRLAVHMYFDPRYRISRTTQFTLPGIALLMLFNYFFFTVWVPIAFFSPIAERLIDVFLCVIGYKLLIRELGRYRDVLDYLARYSHH
jgi:hypothetical protein